MINKNKAQANISEAFIRLLMARNRFIISKPEDDFGVDLTISYVEKVKRVFGDSMELDTGKSLDIQLKCTTERYFKKLNTGDYEFLLKINNYENLVIRKNRGLQYKKLILIVFILPDKEEDWMEIFDDYIRLSKNAFWYYPSDQDTLERTKFKDKKYKVPITMSSNNRLGLDFKKTFELFHDN